MNSLTSTTVPQYENLKSVEERDELEHRRSKYVYSVLSHSFICHFISHNLRIHCTAPTLTPPWVNVTTDAGVHSLMCQVSHCPITLIYVVSKPHSLVNMHQ